VSGNQRTGSKEVMKWSQIAMTVHTKFTITNLPTSVDFYNMKDTIDIAEGIKYLLHNKAL